MSLPPRQSRTTLSPHASSYSGMGDLLAARRKQSILVVDDNLMNAALLKEMLALRGYQTTAVTNAAAAEAEIRREARDPYTEGHCERLARDASDLGRFLGLEEECIVALQRGGYLHDLGKIAVPDEILKKGGNLTPAEWEIMMQHPVTGETICRPLTSLRLVLPIIRYHHEHSDGSG